MKDQPDLRLATMTTDSSVLAASAAGLEPHRAQTDAFTASPALARTTDGVLWMAYLAFDGEAERVRLARAADAHGGAWETPLDVSPPGVVFPPAIGVADGRLWVFWTARDPGHAPAEQATFSLWGRPFTTGAADGSHEPIAPIRFAGSAATAGRPLNPRVASGHNGELWLVYELWDAGSGSEAPHASQQQVTLRLQRIDERPAEPIHVPAPPRAGASRMYDPTITVGTDGAVHVAWWSPNQGESWDRPGTRSGTTADDLHTLGSEAALGEDDGASTGADVWHARYVPDRDGGNWTHPERLNQTAGWHLHPTIAAGASGRVWVTWAAVTGAEIYAELTSDIPYVQTARSRARRAPWFREARPVVRILSGGGWHVPNTGAAAAEPRVPAEAEPGLVWDAGHTLFPVIVCTGSSQDTSDGQDGQDVPVLVIRRYGQPQAGEMNTGEQVMRLRAFETAALWLTPEGWTGATPLHEPALGGILAAPAVLAGDGNVVAAWQADLGTRNTRSDICLGRAAMPATTAGAGGLLPVSARAGSGEAGVSRGSGLSGTRKAGAPFFGNIHMHTEQSFCRRATSLLLDFNYRWAQDCMRQDFAVLTDHAETKSAYEWWLNRKWAAFFTTPSFVALLGYEWTTRFDPTTGEGHGHLDVYFRGDPPRFWPANAVESSTTTGLWELLAKGEAEGYPAFTAAHHPAVGVFRRSWERWGQEQHEPVVEIHQDRRGSFERPGCTGGAVLPPNQYVAGHYVSDALARGYRLGFVSGGDHMGISMTAVLAGKLTREAIFDAIRARHCYAVTGAKVLIDLSLSAGGTTAGIGKLVPLVAASEASIVARVGAPAPIRRLALVVDGADVATQEPGNTHAAWDVLAQVRPGGNCYLRVELTDGEIAWTSPVFFGA
ncbi:MAG: hypothetical protein AVDCRST_MAG77-3150 [uncultured Chloroflexi bacterium]|uniref:Uncharacterized protein n=1 Tax=uncultured Chloroflexota bacterium TaxID=166587 RepID=A0A6J4J8S9_9CHLR|nr:MAG: hypothetical protein AVDCRST_MAG77-3150 [uncultured Chloroflexota bacterium]